MRIQNAHDFQTRNTICYPLAQQAQTLEYIKREYRKQKWESAANLIYFRPLVIMTKQSSYIMNFEEKKNLTQCIT